VITIGQKTKSDQKKKIDAGLLKAIRREVARAIG
jgi:hypothetical protein